MKPTIKSLAQEAVVLLADSRVKIALITLLLNILGIVGLNKYGDIATKAITDGNIVAGLLIAGISYEKGKAAEGTVPEGRQSVYTPMVDPDKAADLLTSINTQLESAPVKEVLDDVGSIKLPNFPKGGGGGGGPKAAVVGLVLALSLMFVGTGCQSLAGTGATTQPTVLTPQQRSAQSLATVERGYALALNALNDAETLGVITPAEYEQTAPYRQATTAALNAADAAVTNNSSTADASIEIAGATLASLVIHPVMTKAKAAPTTKGSQ